MMAKGDEKAATESVIERLQILEDVVLGCGGQDPFGLVKRVMSLERSRTQPDHLNRRIAELEAENAKLREAMKKMCDSAYAIKKATEPIDPF
jgi:hypothetical protein